MFRKSVPTPPKAAAPLEDDNISLTSTQESIHSDGHEFVVERILAQKHEGKNRMFLIQWEGYPLHRSTWEPRGNIVDHRIFDDWMTRRSQESKGKEQPFDVAAFEALLDRLDREKEARRSRRNLKKKHLGLVDEDSSDSSSDEALEYDEVTEYKGASRPHVKPARPKLSSGSNKTPSLSTKQKSSANALPPSKSALPDKATSSSKPSQSSKPASSSKPLLVTKSSTSTSDSDAPLAARRRKTDVNPSNLQGNSGPSNMQPNPSASRGMGAIRGKSAYPNVFARRSPTRKDGRRNTLADNAVDPSKGQSHFKTLHLVNKAKLSAKDKAEATAPDVSVVGGLFKPGEGGPQFEPLKVPRRPSQGFPQARASENVDASESDRPVSSVASASFDRYFSRGETTCYYWHVGKGASGSCTQYFMCDFMHEYRPGHPIAPKPAFLHEEAPRPARQTEQLRCFFYVKRGRCKYGDSCSRLHSHDESIPVAPNPNKKNEPCQYWLKGNCKHSKDDCLYRHENPDGIRALTQADFDKAPAHVHEAQSSISMGRRVKVCPNFMARNGTCRYGLACYYSHERPEQPTPNSDRLTKSVSFAVDNQLELFEEPQSIINVEAEQPRRAHDQSAMPPPAFNLTASGPLPLVKDGQSYQAPDQSSMLPPQAAHSTESKPERKRISISDYTRQKAPSNIGARAKKFTFGSNGNPSIVMDIGDLGQGATEPGGLFLAPLTDITLDKEVMAKDLETHYSFSTSFRKDQVLIGNLSPRDKNNETANLIDKVVKHCLTHSCGFIFHSQGFNILVFPEKSDVWNFFSLAQCPSDVQLRYMVLKTDLDIGACLKTLATEFTISQTTTSQNDTPQNSTPTNHQNDLNDLVHKLYLDEIAPPSHRDVAFFLIFPKSEQTIADFITGWLKQSRSNCKIYTGDYRDWKSFLSTNTFTHGSIIMHDTLACHIDWIPHVQKTLVPHLSKKPGERKKQYGWWSITDGHQHGNPTLFPDTHARAEKDRGPLESVPIFPFGAAILLTQSFLIAEPKRAYEVLRWFFGKVENGRHIKGQMGKYFWRIVVPQGIVKYTHDLACAKDVESTRYLEENRHKPSREADAEKLGLGYANCALRFEIYAFLADLKHLGVIENPDYAWPDYLPSAGEARYEEHSPIIYSPKWIYTHDEIDLVHWFAAWSILRIDSYRKIVVLGTNSSSRHKLKRLVKVPVGTEIPEESYYRDGSLHTTFVPPPEIQCLQEPQEPRIEEPANGGGLDVEAQIVELLNDEKKKAPVASSIPSKSASGTPSISAGPKNGEIEFPFVQYPNEPLMEWKEKTYEHTTSWFRKCRARPERHGIMFEGMYVEAYQKIFPYIGVNRT